MTTILLVEDETEILTTQAELMRMAGFDVITAKSATEATLILDSGQQIDVLFSDIRLGNESGLDLAYRTHMQYPDIVVILTTGYSGGNGEVRWPLLMKPYLCEKAVELINKVLVQRRT